MKMSEALDYINNEPQGFMVNFEWCGDGFLRSDHFPDKWGGEELIESEDKAWRLAYEFARATKGRTANIYVTDHKLKPLPDHMEKMIKNR